jgi:HSP20 family protein
MTFIKFKNEGNLSERFPMMPTVFGNFFNDILNVDSTREVYNHVPAVNISEHANDFSIEVAAPGLSREDFSVKVDNGIITISASKKEEKKDENSKYARKEFSYSSFKRSFSLPEQVDTERIEAMHKDGVLTLTLPKKEEAKPKAAKEIKVS